MRSEEDGLVKQDGVVVKISIVSNFESGVFYFLDRGSRVGDPETHLF